MKCQPIPISEWDSYSYKNFKIIIAKTPCQRQQGFQYVKKTPLNTFLLFYGIKPGIFFHTNNCYFPLDIIALDANSHILGIWTVNINKNSIGPMPPSTKNVIETRAGWVQQNKLKIGDAIPFIKI